MSTSAFSSGTSVNTVTDAGFWEKIEREKKKKETGYSFARRPEMGAAQHAMAFNVVFHRREHFGGEKKRKEKETGDGDAR